MKKQVAVKEIAYFLYSSGDLTSEFFSNYSSLDGTKAHQYLQKKYNDDSKSEFYVKYETEVNNYNLTITGFIDGVLNSNGKTMLEEIKSTKNKLDEIDIDYHKEHLAQLKFYAYIYCKNNNLDGIDVRLTYIKIVSYDVKSFDMYFTLSELEKFFTEGITKYTDWLSILDETSANKIDSIKNIKFPFDNMRDGQRDLMKAAFFTMKKEDILYVLAPTGIGKTMATLFSSLKTIEDPNEKLFYLTAKSIQKNICVDGVKILEKSGLKLKTLVLTSKTKSCLNDKKNCDPEKCGFAKGFFNRLRGAFDEIYSMSNIYDSALIDKIAIKHTICSFEFSLYLSYFCDLIICDYNYVFDPKSHLIRYFDDTSYKPKILIDEAHNLISRSKDMYSASIFLNDVLRLNEIVYSMDVSFNISVKQLVTALSFYEEKITQELFYYSYFLDDNIYNCLYKIKNKCETIFTDNESFLNRDEAIDLYFRIKDFADISEYFTDSHVFMITKQDDNYEISINCLDASEYLLDTIKNKCYGTILFSATLYPINYHMDLLTKGEGKYLTLTSPFEKDNLKLIIKDNVSTKYKDRENSINDVINTCNVLLNSKRGNYIVFFPSYKYIELFLEHFNNNDYNVIVQNQEMNENERNKIFESFKEEEKNKLGLFVMGGVFSEGLDYVADALSGVVIVGVGIPQINTFNNISKDFFDGKYEKGFDYAYTYPGFNKVVQAAGRVIRTESDRGVVVLIDERYRYKLYRDIMPTHWKHAKIINNDELLKIELNHFWNK